MEVNLNQLVSACELSTTSNAVSELISWCQDSLRSSGASIDVVKALADIARDQHCREAVLDSSLLAILCSVNWPSSNGEFLIQLCRLCGNLCFDSPLGRDILSNGGMMDKISTYTSAASWIGHEKLWVVLPAFLHNFCADNLQCLETVKCLTNFSAEHFIVSSNETVTMEAEAPQVYEDALDSYIGYLSGLTDHEGKELMFTNVAIISSISSILSVSTSAIIDSNVLDLLQDLCEDEGVSLLFVQDQIVEKLLVKMETWNSELLATSLDLLALLSSHPTVLPLILHPDSQLHHAVIRWFTSDSSSVHQKATAALVYGNFCTTDDNCLQLLSTTIPPVLVTLLIPSSDSKLLHAVVGCLRNLSVCVQGRDQLRSLFLPEASCQLLMHLSGGSDHTVTPKVLSTLRLVTQGDQSSCSKIGMDTILLAEIVKIAQISIVPALNIEATRLISSLVRYSKNEEVLFNAISIESIPLLLGLLNSQHPQLVNEMLVALNLICIKSPHPNLVTQIDAKFLASKLVEILKKEDVPHEIKTNVLTLIHSTLLWNLAFIKECYKDEHLLEFLSSNSSADEPLVVKISTELS